MAILNRNVATNRDVVTAKRGHNFSKLVLGYKCCGHATYEVISKVATTILTEYWLKKVVATFSGNKFLFMATFPFNVATTFLKER